MQHQNQTPQRRGESELDIKLKMTIKEKVLMGARILLCGLWLVGMVFVIFWVNLATSVYLHNFTTALFYVFMPFILIPTIIGFFFLLRAEWRRSALFTAKDYKLELGQAIAYRKKIYRNVGVGMLLMLVWCEIIYFLGHTRAMTYKLGWPRHVDTIYRLTGVRGRLLHNHVSLFLETANVNNYWLFHPGINGRQVILFTFAAQVILLSLIILLVINYFLGRIKD